MRTITIVVSAIAFVIALLIAFNKPGMESYLGVAVTLAALLASYFLVKEKDKSPTIQRQEVKDGSYGIQAGRDISGGTFNQKDK